MCDDLAESHDRLHVVPSQSQLAIFPDVCDITEKEALGAEFWEQEYEQTMAVCMILAVSYSAQKTDRKNNTDPSSSSLLLTDLHGRSLLLSSYWLSKKNKC